MGEGTSGDPGQHEESHIVNHASQESDQVGTDLERRVIGGLLLLDDDPVPPNALVVEPEYFESQRMAAIYSAISDLQDDGGPTDIVTVSEKLRSWGINESLLLAELAWDIPTAANLDHWASILVEAGRKSELRRRVEESVKRVDGEDFDSIAAGVQDAMASIESASDSGGFKPIKEILGKVMKEVLHEMNNPGDLRFASTGIESVDEILKLSSSELLIIGGRPSMGKTAFAGNIAQYIAKKENGGGVAIFSMEMSASALVRRMMASVVPSSCDGSLTQAVARSHGEQVFGRVADLDLVIDDRPNLSTADMRRSMLRLQNPRVVIVDYIQLAKTNAKLERQDLRVGAISKGLKAIAKEFDCLVIALSQLNRDVETSASRKPEMRHLRNSGEIEEDADAIALLYRPSHYKLDGDDEIIIAKQRNGPTGTAYVQYKATTQKFVSVNEPYRDNSPTDHRHTDFHPEAK